MATELVLLSPGPGRVLERLPLEFARRYVAGEPVRSINPIRCLLNSVNTS